MSTPRSFIVTLFLTLVLSAIGALAETHTISFDNKCGHGTPLLIQKGNILSQGEPFVSNGAFFSGIAYLQTGNCNLNGEGCTLVEMSLINPSCPGCGSSTDISLIPPLGFSVPVHFSYYGGCEGQGATCSSSTCSTAFFKPDDNHVQVACQSNDVNLLITFCPDGGAPAPGAPKPTSPSPSTKTTKAAVEPVPATTLGIVDNPASSGVPLPLASPISKSRCSANRTASRRRSLQARSISARHARRRSERLLFDY